MEETGLEEVVADMQEFINVQVAAGFLSADEIVETAVEVLSDEFPAHQLQGHAVEIVRRLMDSHMTKQASWEPVTDCDRLDRAFEDLEEQGIISRQNFSCCGTCGTVEIVDEMENAQKAGKVVRGYTFYHIQDTESAVEGNGVYLNYGSAYDNFLAQIMAGHKIVRVIKKHGLRTEWNGSLKKRILVHLDWKRRR